MYLGILFAQCTRYCQFNLTYLFRIGSFHSYECNVISGVKLSAAMVLPFRTVNVSRHDDPKALCLDCCVFLYDSFLRFDSNFSNHTREYRYIVCTPLSVVRGVCHESWVMSHEPCGTVIPVPILIPAQDTGMPESIKSPLLTFDVTYVGDVSVGGGLPAGRTARIYSNPHRWSFHVLQHDKWKTNRLNSAVVTGTASSLFFWRTTNNLFTPLPNRCGVCVAHPFFSTNNLDLS